ncbi:hypothetical protein BDZ94DRAFT_1327658 [Collybia nuda]|uniref:Uncharacterized protein n=1 Tax=Collybia nuda TaxID=64659 RepID=A0A9P5XQX8_9AGAR|nr:hypothetical protein BDZ94DRAFT_1327658 [Collybia nuda]
MDAAHEITYARQVTNYVNGEINGEHHIIYVDLPEIVASLVILIVDHFQTLNLESIIIVFIVVVTRLRGFIGYQPPPFLSLRGCFDTDGSAPLFIPLVMLLMNETITFSLTIWVGIIKYRHTINPLVVVLYRDGILHFAFIFAISCSYILVLTVGSKEYHYVINM